MNKARARRKALLAELREAAEDINTNAIYNSQDPARPFITAAQYNRLNKVLSGLHYEEAKAKR